MRHAIITTLLVVLLPGCALFSSDPFTRADLALLADDLEDSVDIGLAFKPELEGDPFVVGAKALAIELRKLSTETGPVELEEIVAALVVKLGGFRNALVIAGLDEGQAAAAELGLNMILRRIGRASREVTAEAPS